MRLVEYENLIKSKVQKNPSDPSIYEDLQKMTITFLKRKKACKSISDYEDISYIIAGDIFMKISNCEKISYYLGYLEKIYRRYIITYYNENISDNTVSFEDEDFEKTLVYLKSYDDYVYVENKLYLANVKQIISQILQQSCKYAPDKLTSLNLHLSLIVSLLRGESIGYHLAPDQEFYLNLIVTNFYSKIISDIRETPHATIKS